MRHRTLTQKPHGRKPIQADLFQPGDAAKGAGATLSHCDMTHRSAGSILFLFLSQGLMAHGPNQLRIHCVGEDELEPPLKCRLGLQACSSVPGLYSAVDGTQGSRRVSHQMSHIPSALLALHRTTTR